MAELTSPQKPAEITVTKSDLDQFLKERQEARSDIQEATGDIGALHKKLVDEKGVNKKGLATFAQYAEMKPSKRADALRTFDALRAFFGNEWKNPDLVDQAEQG